MQNIAIFASGSGSNTGAICQYFSQHPRYRVVLILCDKPEAGVYEVAEHYGIPTRFLSADVREPAKLLSILKTYNIRFILLAGYLRLMPLELIAAFPQRILNIHPALLPDFGGKGMYGRHVHNAVIKSGVNKSGITIHIADQHYDEGDILFQSAVDIPSGMNANELQKEVNELELKYYPPVAESYFDFLNQKS
jgi:phosphoribosylglycinamide formyltransferase-1